MYFQVPLENRQAQSDYRVDQLRLKRGNVIEQRSRNQIVVDIRTSTIADIVVAEESAELTQVAALSAYSDARVSLDQVLGETIEKTIF
jgi:hypothetical protein